MTLLPASHDDKLNYIMTAAKHGDAISKMLVVGGAAESLRTYVAQTKDLSLTETDGNNIIIHYGDLVNWTITVNQNEIIQGYGFSGYGDLMEKLGMDFAGMPYEAG